MERLIYEGRFLVNTVGGIMETATKYRSGGGNDFLNVIRRH